MITTFEERYVVTDWKSNHGQCWSHPGVILMVYGWTLGHLVLACVMLKSLKYYCLVDCSEIATFKGSLGLCRVDGNCTTQLVSKKGARKVLTTYNAHTAQLQSFGSRRVDLNSHSPNGDKVSWVPEAQCTNTQLHNWSSNVSTCSCSSSITAS